VAYNAGSGSAQFGFSAAGTLVYRIGGPAGRLVSVQWVDRQGNAQPLLAKPGFYERPSLSPDGERLAMEITDGSVSDIWIYEWRRDLLTRLTNGNGGDPGPVWSPDGRFSCSRLPSGILWARADGSGQPQTLTQSKNVQQPWSFFSRWQAARLHGIDPHGRVSHLDGVARDF
jgi:serine/threonine-protein kinase